ncbi:MAG: hypothetical protein JWN46_2975 [Acidimicrobiales bacterium]|nr:hypothetical protein [Acidimicrobiales bacterium]
MSDWTPPPDPNVPPGAPQQPPAGPPPQYAPQGPPPQYPPPQYAPQGPPPQYPPAYGAYPQPGYPPAASAYGAPPFAGFGARLGALLIDGIITAIPFGIAFAVLAGGPKSDKLTTCTVNGVEHLCRTPAGSTWAMFAVVCLLGLAFAIWYQVLLLGKTGQTWGCKAVNIKVVDKATGTPIGGGRAFARWLVASIASGNFCLLGYLWMLWDSEKQTWHDKVASSYVIRA